MTNQYDGTELYGFQFSETGEYEAAQAESDQDWPWQALGGLILLASAAVVVWAFWWLLS